MARIGGGLEAGGRVHRVAGQHAVARACRSLHIDQDVAGLDPDPHRELRLPLRREPVVQLGQDRLHLERGADGPLRIVLMRLRHPEHREHRVAHELLEQPAVALDLDAQPVERAPHHGLHDLRVLLLGERRRSHQIGEERRRELQLGARLVLGTERRRAVQAELRPLGVLLAAARAGDHARLAASALIASTTHRCARSAVTSDVSYGGETSTTSIPTRST